MPPRSVGAVSAASASRSARRRAEVLEQAKQMDAVRTLTTIVNDMHVASLLNWEDDTAAGFAQALGEFEALLFNPPSE